MPFWVLFFLFVGSTALSALLQRRPKDAQPSGLGDFQVPTAEAGRVIPVIFGTVKLRGPNVTWFGDLINSPIRKSSGLFTKSTVGYYYYAGMQQSLCHGPVDELVDIVIGDKYVSRVAVDVDPPLPLLRIEGSVVGPVYLEAPDMFGGELGEGGIEGDFKFYFGAHDQSADAYLTSQFGEQAPAYRGICHIVLGDNEDDVGRDVAKQMYFGTSNFIKDWAFILRRFPDHLCQGGDVVNLGGDANPAEMILEIMTNPVWGLGRPVARFDLDSFEAAAATLADEGMGMSMILDNPAAADQVIGDILRHIDGAIYTDPATGLWTLKLARADYDTDDLIELNQSNLLQAPEFGRGSWRETLNEVKVKYIDRSMDFTEQPAQAQETANFAAVGELTSETIPFLGFSKASIAQKVAMRELKTNSYPAALVSLKANRTAWNMRLAGVFKLTWPPLGISEMVLRITAINYGALDKGEITIEAVEDIFSVAHTAYTTPVGSRWVDTPAAGTPDGEPAPIGIPLEPGAAGTFTVPHGLGDMPGIILVQMTSGGSIWVTGWDDTNVFLVASDDDVTGNLIVSTATADATLDLAPGADGDFTVAHGVGTPALVLIQMSSGGNIWFQSPTDWDATNLYLTASDAGVTGKAYVWEEVPDIVLTAPFTTVALAPTSAGNFAVPHGLPAAPVLVLIRMTSSGAIWQREVPFDENNIYLVASDADITGEAEVWGS